MRKGNKVLIFKEDTNWDISRYMVGKIATVKDVNFGGNEVGVDFGNIFINDDDVSRYLHSLRGCIRTDTGYYLSRLCLHVI